MKKTLPLLLGALAIFNTGTSFASTNIGTRAGTTADLSGAPATREQTNVNYKKYTTRTTTKTYETKNDGDMYYVKPTNRDSLYKSYTGAQSSAANANKTTVRKTRSENITTKMRRKYYLAHPFFQPLGEKFGSITDLNYTNSSYDFVINQTIPTRIIGSGTGFSLAIDGVNGKWNTNQFSVTEHFSYGINDRVALVGLLELNIDDYKFEYDNGSPADTMDDSGLNLFGFGAQWRFVDNEKWIATASAYFQHQQDVSNNFLIDIKGGYKVSKSTIYGLVRGWYIDLEGNSYGNGITGNDEYGAPATFYIPYQVGDSNAMYIEGGLGVFSVLNEDWTLNVEGIFGHYDWHNQASIKGAIGWQPNDWFALNLYAKTAFYDSANSKNLDLYWMEPHIEAENPADGTVFPLNQLTNIGTVKLDNVSETTIGLQAIFQF